MSNRGNIVQLELFQVNVRARSFGELTADIHARNADGAALKINLRFFDSNGDITFLALKVQRLERWSERLEQTIKTKTGWRQAFANSLHQTAMRWIRQTKEASMAGAKKKLYSVIKTLGEVAVEEPDRSFRFLRANEIYETTTSVEKAKGAWIFIFKPNDLIADNDETVVSII